MFEEQKVLLTGGSSGIGRALAERLAARGAHLALVARDPGKLGRVRDALSATAAGGRRVEVYPCDVTDPAQVEATVRAVAASMGPPDILINSAGILREGRFETQPVDVFREIMETNFYGTLHFVHATLPHLLARGSGRIVNLSSLGGLMGVFGYSAYCASKFAVTGLTQTLRCELKPRGIRVHLVCPPETDTPMVDEINRYRSPENRELVHTIPVLSAGRVADEILRGLEADRFEIVPGRIARTMAALDRWVPSLSRTVVDSRLRKVYRVPEG